MPQRPSSSTIAAFAWATLSGLLALRLPALLHPVGSDQNIYMYVADRILEGGVPYVDGWDQKPPGIGFVYAGLRAVWPHPSIVATADIVVAALVAALLVWMGRRTVSRGAGYLAAGIFLLFGNPAIGRIGGVFTTGQCETFIALAVTTAIVLLGDRQRTAWRCAGAGLCLGAAFWLKYNTLTYVLPIGVALYAWPSGTAFGARRATRELALVGAGFAFVATGFLVYFAAHHALGDLWLNTIEYNLRYSRETYTSGPLGAVTHLLEMPVVRARVDALWFLGTSGAVLLIALGRRRAPSAVLVAVSWLIASIVSIAINGARDLPQYFVQAAPALAFAAGAGLTLAARTNTAWRMALAVLCLAGMWKVGVEAPSAGGLRWGGLPQLVSNIRFDLADAAGHVERPVYLARFSGGQKYDPAGIEELTQIVRSTTSPADTIYVFGFSPGVYVEGDRRSASRFIWSRPVIMEFAAGHPGYGSSGLLADLERSPPSLVALQKRDWWPDVQNSMEFFLSTPPLRAWLDAGYVFDRETAVFAVWRRK